jgi:prevent-host-death family protein
MNREEDGMTTTINAKELRASLPEVVERVRRGARFTVIYRSRPAFQIVPVDESSVSHLALEEDSLYHARPVGRSKDGRTAAEHDVTLYGER